MVLKNIRGVGTVVFRLDVDETLEIDDVLYVPGLRDNLISVSALEDAEMAVKFRNGHVPFYDIHVHPIRLVYLGERQDRLYVLRGQHTPRESGWLTDSGEEAQRIDEAPQSQSIV